MGCMEAPALTTLHGRDLLCCRSLSLKIPTAVLNWGSGELQLTQGFPGISLSRPQTEKINQGFYILCLCLYILCLCLHPYQACSLCLELTQIHLSNNSHKTIKIWKSFSRQPLSPYSSKDTASQKISIRTEELICTYRYGQI